jgi:hypothetical protein
VEHEKIEELRRSSRAEKEKNSNAGAREGLEEGRSSLGAFPKPKRGTRAGGKQLLVVDGARGGLGRQRRNVSTRGASGVGRAAGGRAGGQVAQEERRGGSWRPGETPAMGGGRR